MGQKYSVILNIIKYTSCVYVSLYKSYISGMGSLAGGHRILGVHVITKSDDPCSRIERRILVQPLPCFPDGFSHKKGQLAHPNWGPIWK